MKNINDCLICERLKKPNRFFVKEMETGVVVIGDNQYYEGYTLFLAREHVSELHQLKDRDKHLREMGQVAKAVYRAFQPAKLNYELLGNTHSHIHWHLIPRNDKKSGPIWVDLKKRNVLPEELVVLKNRLRKLL